MSFAKTIFSRRSLIAVLLAALLIASLLCPESFWNIFDIQSISYNYISEKQEKALQVTSACAIAATTIAAVPDDSTTPIANQIASVADYMMIATVGLTTEKIIVKVSGFILFRVGIPLSCLLFILRLFTKRRGFRQLGASLLIIALSLYIMVPITVELSKVIDRDTDFESRFNKLINEEEAADEVAEEAEDDRAWYRKIYDSVAGAVESVTGSVSNLIEYSKNLLSSFINTAAEFIITTVVLPICVFMFLKWIITQFATAIMRSFTDAINS